MHTRKPDYSDVVDGGTLTTGTNRMPAVWLPTIQAGTGSDVFTRRLRDGLQARGIRAEIEWLPHRAEYLPWTVKVPQPPAWANVVHVNSWLPKRFWPTGLPVVVTVHHLVHDQAYHPFRSMAQAAYHEALIRRRELRAISEADAVTTVSDYVRRTVVTFSGRADVEVIYNWVDTDLFKPGKPGRPHAQTPFRLFMAGSRSKRKGFDLLPGFVAALGPGFEIRYGGGPIRQRSRIPGVVELGRLTQDDLIREYQKCDAVVSLSRYEGFGYTALEAIACGKPFLGFRTSALPEVVGEDGDLVMVDDVGALADAAIRLSTSDGRADQSTDRSTALQAFSTSNVDKYVETYSALIAPLQRLKVNEAT